MAQSSSETFHTSYNNNFDIQQKFWNDYSLAFRTLETFQLV